MRAITQSRPITLSPRHPVTWSLLAITGAAIISTVFSVSLDRSLQYLSLWAVYVAVGLFAYWQPERVRAVLPWVGMAVSVVTVAEWLIMHARPWLVYNPNATASWLLLLLPWMGAPTSIPFIVGVIALAVTGSRGAWLGLAGALFALIARPKWWVWLAGVVGLAAGLLERAGFTIDSEEQNEGFGAVYICTRL